MEYPKIITKLPGPKATEIIERESRILSPGIGVKLFPLVPKRGFGALIEDVDGNIFIDFLAGAAAASTGYSHPKLVKAVQEQVALIQHSMIGYTHNERAIRVAEKLAKISPIKNPRIIFGMSGSDAVDMAIKVSKFSTRRPWILSFIGAYHGQTLGATSIAAFQSSQKRGFSPLMPNVIWLPYPNPYRNIWGIDGYEEPNELINRFLDYLENYVFSHLSPSDEVAALFAEPIQGDAGIVVPPENFFKEVQKVLNDLGILLVMDEVQTGIGRTGKWFASEWFSVEPDLIIFGKGVASGMGLSGVIGRKELMDLTSGAALLTPAANPVVSAAAEATLEIIEEENLLENALKVGNFIKKRLEEMKEVFEVIGDVRGKGLMIGVEIVKDRESKKPDPELTGKICWRAFELGLILPSYGMFQNVIRITPPLVITQEIAEKGLEIMERAIKDALAGKVERKVVTWH
ncbi:aspartate aminotransferase family protein [Pyrococcus furiosus DSM 3638]|uniref:Aspartate aminotransferase family protein n=3 Tax=Pyrococcus furiosus TaxID=2261 RepID=A0A5C0XP80_PYRFU|nr:acetyl ornithine aminotransferase family protein [Pyrococcus furiosus]AAL80637.1 putative glutamate aminotransferase [Pyrococcus furiosus DSM 3638]AFN03308.1 4-aminobutyrate aminotransferase [Pyrococcus furiosus COM1]QEK78225.1 aspartate aminotransferase family protein [Pyrococcus furiosus DSM 3638]